MNGYTNWETWNVAAWIGNDELLYNISTEASDYTDFLQRISWYSQGATTPDGVKWDSPDLDRTELDELIQSHT